MPRTINTIEISEIPKENTSIRAIHVIDEQTMAYVGSNGDFSMTSDGGITWTSQTIKYQDSILPHFRSMEHNGKDYFALSIGNPALLYKISNAKIELVYEEQNEKVFYDSMHFFQGNVHGIAVGDPTEDCPSIILTEDGGKTWEKLSCDDLPKFDDGEAFFAASNTNIKTLGSTAWIASGGKKARVLRSHDYGKTWEIFDTPIIQGDGPQGIYSIDFFDHNHGIVIGGDYSKPLENTRNKAITNDGGENWKIIADQSEPNYKSCIKYVPNTNGKEIFAVGKTGVSYSNNGGETWKKLSEDAYYTIEFVDNSTAWLAGHEKIGKLKIN